ncbi:unnamed protein product [Lactuca saligna]|uniref:Uncharacterized protein n=1 Tax=Lactuca saligna TaxID=75948 RepID=A0AA35ZYU9_LACSI|nr:unnamed protein product [Lactuca saligna]
MSNLRSDFNLKKRVYFLFCLHSSKFSIVGGTLAPSSLRHHSSTITSDHHRPSPPSSQISALVSDCKRPDEKGHPKAASFRTIPLPFPDLYARIFDGNSVTGNFRSYSTQSSSVVGASSCRVPPLQITATSFLAIDDDGDDTSHHEPRPSDASSYTASSSGNPNKRAKPSTPIAPSASPSTYSPDGTSIIVDDLAFE